MASPRRRAASKAASPKTKKPAAAGSRADLRWELDELQPGSRTAGSSQGRATCCSCGPPTEGFDREPAARMTNASVCHGQWVKPGGMGGGGSDTDGEAALRTQLRRAALIAEDERWAVDPVAMVAEVQREAFAAGVATTDGFAQGVLAAAQHIERVAPSLPQCAWTIPRALARVLRELVNPAPVSAPAPAPEPNTETGATAPQETA